MSKENKKKSGMGKFFIGAAIGAGLGILFAPNKGSETRKQLKNKMDELIMNLREIDVNEVKKSIEDKINEIKEEIKDLDKEKMIAIAKKKATQIKNKATELVNLAREKGTPVLQDLAIGVMTKTDEVLKETILKLEKAKKETVKGK